MEIRLTPYDILKMSEYLKLNTMDFIDQYVLFLDLKQQHLLIPVLKDVKQGFCTFRKNSRCSIHPSRSLNCRLFTVAHKENIFFIQKTTYCKGEYTNGEASLQEYLKGSEVYLKSGESYHKILKTAEDVFSIHRTHPLMKQYFFHILFDYDSIHRDMPLFSQRSSEEKFEIIIHQSLYFLKTFLETETVPFDALWDDYFNEGESFIYGNFKR